MKRTKKKIIYTVLEVLFIGIAPAIFVFLEYGNIGHTNDAVGFKLGFVGILLAVLILLILKKTVLKKWAENLLCKIQQYQNTLPIETDKAKIGNLKRELKTARTIQTVFNAVMPLVLLIGLLLICKALESAVVKLSGAVGFTIISFCVGTVFSILNSREVTSKNARKN